jgi:hypothetical protein
MRDQLAKVFKGAVVTYFIVPGQTEDNYETLRS